MSRTRTKSQPRFTFFTYQMWDRRPHFWVNIDTKIKNETGSYMSLTNAAVQDAQGFAGRGESALIHQKQKHPGRHFSNELQLRESTVNVARDTSGCVVSDMNSFPQKPKTFCMAVLFVWLFISTSQPCIFSL